MIRHNNNLFNPEMIQGGCCCPEKRRDYGTDCSHLFLKVLLVSLSTRETTLSSKILAKMSPNRTVLDN